MRGVLCPPCLPGCERRGETSAQTPPFLPRKRENSAQCTPCFFGELAITRRVLYLSSHVLEVHNEAYYSLFFGRNQGNEAQSAVRCSVLNVDHEARLKVRLWEIPIG